MADLSAELKAAMASKQENERRRKQLERYRKFVILLKVAFSRKGL